MKFIKDYKKLNIFHFMVPVLILVLIGSYLIDSYLNSFDETVFSVDNVYEHIRELSSPEYNGRLASTEGNELALKYVENYFKSIGVEPGGENNSYYQSFESMVPQIDDNPYFRIENEKGEVLEEFIMYEDYKYMTTANGGGGRFEGEILCADRYLSRIPPELIYGRLVLIRGYSLRNQDIEYVLKNGGKGIIFSTTDYYSRYTSKKSIGRAGKDGRTILIAAIDSKAYVRLKKISDHDLVAREFVMEDGDKEYEIPKAVGIIKGAKVKCDIGFPILETANIIGKIEGKKKDAGYLLIGAHLDHVGSGPHGKYFPGALDNASGIGMMLELARVIKQQKNLPDKTIIFAGWNAEENGINGSRYYVENPIYPLDKTQVINLDCIGGSESREIVIDSGYEVGRILRNKLYQYAEDADIKAREFGGGYGSDHQPFIEAGVPAVLIIDSENNIHSYEDTIDNVSKDNLKKVGSILTSYIKRDIFKDTLPDYLNQAEMLLVVLFLMGIIFIYIIFSLDKVNPGMKIFNVSVEDIYYSSIFNMILKCYYYVTPAFVILFSLLFIANLPPSFNLIFYGGHVHTNLSIYLTLKKSVLYMRNLILNGLGTTAYNTKIIDIILPAMIKSLKLISSAVAISFALGIVKGMFDGYRGRGKGDLRTVGTLMALSLPDVLIVLCSLFLIIYIANNDMLKNWVDLKSLRGFIMPLISLSIIPTVYISRITFITIQEEINKGYVKGAKAKGQSKISIFMKHILISVVYKVIDSIPTLMTIIVSNLIIVEYMFNYTGVVYNLYRFYKGNDVTSFIGLSLSLGLIYIAFTAVSKIVSKLINPVKREGVH